MAKNGKMRRFLVGLLVFSLILGYFPANVSAISHPVKTEFIKEEISVNTQSRTSGFLTNYTLTGDGASDMVAIALAQEGRTGSQFGYTEEWCADFVSDCAILAGQSSAVPQYGGVSGLYDRIINAGGTVTTSSPRAGDICFIDWNGGSSMGHVEIVYQVSGSSVYTIGGNSGSGSSLSTRCVKKHAPLSSGYIVKIVRPAYKGGTAPVGTYTVTFNANGGSCAESSRQVTSDTAIGTLPAATRDGYYLTGWATSNGTPVDASYPITSNITIYAQWSSDCADIGDNFYAKIIHKASGHGICNTNGNVELGQRGSLNNIWRFERRDNGSYEIISVVDDKRLDVQNNNTADESNVWVYEDNDSIAQRWYIRLTGSGYTFIAANSGKALDVYMGSSDSTIGTNVQLYNAHYGEAQTMYFEKIENPGLGINETENLSINHGGDRAYIQVQMPTTITLTLTKIHALYCMMPNGINWPATMTVVRIQTSA